ncbi:MAG TPA: formate dehydrogenase accessory sulfurtransferase FdhD [Myxococcota bacterium]
MTDADLARTFRVAHVHASASSERDERVAHEEPLEIRVRGASVAVLMRTPGNDEELARGFALTEGIARNDQIESVRHCTSAPDPESEDNVIDVNLRADVVFDLEKHRRHTFASSSCGVCGKATIENACRVAAPLVAKSDGVRVAASTITRMPEQLREAQHGFASTGGLHAAALFTSAGALLLAREDVGRHNAVDKVIGANALLHGNADARVLFVSGRVSFELVQKAVAARIAIIAGISAPSSLAVRMARALGLTLVGFVRGSSMNVYAHPVRIE